MSFFSNAQGFAINDRSFTNVAYNFHLRHGEGDDQDFPGKGLEILFQNAVGSAAHDAEQRFPPPNCYPGTRTQILEILRNWVNNSAETAPVYWLYGAAGVGKSAVAQTISEEFANSHLAASFFFSRADPARNHLQQFFTTISLQLATSHILGPLLSESIDLTIRRKRDIVSTNLKRQFQDLIVNPCNQLTAERWKDLPRLIVIDGLDECLDIASQERLLAIIREAESSSMLPFQFLICSRPEPRIRNAFNHKHFRTMVARCDLGEAFESGKDITRYLRKEFKRTRRDHGRTMAHVPKDWPGEEVIQQLVQRACGQFIYATTVLKYVGDYHELPTERLEIILNITVPEDYDSPYPDLDLLYLQILSACKQKELLLEVIAHVLKPSPNIFLRSQYQETSSRCIEGLFFLAAGKVRTLFFGLHSVLNIPDNDYGNITVRHASFVEFLYDKKRSGSYYVDTSPEVRHEQIAFCLLKRISFSIKDCQQLEFPSMNSEFDVYAWDYWYFHCRQAHKSLSHRLLNALEHFDISGFLNVAVRRQNTSLEASILSVRKCLLGLSNVAKWAKDSAEDSREFDALAKRYSLFERGFRVRIVPNFNKRDNERLMMAISIFKYSLCLFRPHEQAMNFALLDNRISPAQVEQILRSYWLCRQILSLEPIDSKSELRLDDTVTIELAECNKHIGLQCLRILREPSQNAKEVVNYAKCWWTTHLLLESPPLSSEPKEVVQALMQNLSAIQTSEQARIAIAWVEESTYAGQIKALHKRLQELEDEEEQKRVRLKEQLGENARRLQSTREEEDSRSADRIKAFYKRAQELEDAEKRKLLRPKKRWTDKILRRLRLR
ncbi:hypothetical protein GYMLUDRAFT_35321 [Collybiopsis luxurians FD-317 M1]|nr:hypothetical protein GYMLUDRAFT_35321 [Collybiopsis luxurians FD-317 M1]